MIVSSTFGSSSTLWRCWQNVDVYPAFKDVDAYYMGLFIIGWSNTFNTKFLNSSVPIEYTDFLKPEFKDKLVLTYPNDDDAVLYQFNLM